MPVQRFHFCLRFGFIDHGPVIIIVILTRGRTREWWAPPRTNQTTAMEQVSIHIMNYRDGEVIVSHLSRVKFQPKLSLFL